MKKADGYVIGRMETARQLFCLNQVLKTLMSSINKHKLQTDQNIPFKSCICRKSQIPQFQLEATLRNIQYV